MIWPFTDPRERIDVNYPDGTTIANRTLGAIWNDYNKMGANIIYNNTWEDREDVINQQMNISIAISAHNAQNTETPDFVDELTLIGVRGATVEEIDESLVLSDDECLWSLPECWTATHNGLVPVAGDTVTIDGSMNIVLDVPAADMPILTSLEINGKLKFQDGSDKALKAYKIWVRAGELQIGNATVPFDARADITLYGNDLEEYWAYTASTEVGNKGLIVTGKVYMYGAARSTATTGRLLATAYAGQDEIYIPANLDWAVGETIGIAATNMRTMDFDYCKILTIESGAGKVKCEAELDGFHFGALDSSETDWGVDMRAEIFIMDRNIKIQASTDDPRSPGLSEAWGARILVADFFEPTLAHRQGMIEFDNVQVYNCSQYMTYKAAITWFQATSLPSKVMNSVISSGRATGIHIENSAQITLTNNVIADFVQQGIWVKTSSDITIDNNWVHHVQPETTAP